MSIPLFLRLLSHEDKDSALLQALDFIRTQSSMTEDVYVADPNTFPLVPGSPFAYWVSNHVRQLFAKLPKLECDSPERAVRVGLQTSDDTRFLRAWWEVGSETILDDDGCDLWKTNTREFGKWCRDETFNGKQWVFFPKGGEYSEFLSDIHLVVKWKNDGEEMKQFAEELKERSSSPPGNGPLRDFPYYFRHGLTWSYRTHRLCLQELPAGTIISTRGSGIFSDKNTLLVWMALGNSVVVDYLVKIGMGREGHPQFDQGDLKEIPVPEILDETADRLQCLSLQALQFKRRATVGDETSPYFVLPMILLADGDNLKEQCDSWNASLRASRASLISIQDEIDSLACELYNITAKERDALVGVTTNGSVACMADAPHDKLVCQLVSYMIGCTFGRCDVRLSVNAHLRPADAEVFQPLRPYPPGMLDSEVNGEVILEEYSYRIDWDGILVDDPEHQDDIVRRVRAVMEVIWKNRAESIEKEACDILGVKTLREFFRKPSKSGFWDDHIKRYSKSRRKAPIYWMLQSSKKNYGIWLYYHRLDKDMLFKALMNYVEPKIQREENRLTELRSQISSAGDTGKAAKKLDREIEKQEDLLTELRDFEEKLRKVADLHLVPDLNDGVVLNIAPLYELVPWKEATKHWNELMDGKYEWSSIGKQVREKGLVK